MDRNTALWIVWLVFSLAAGATIVLGMIYGGPARSSLLIGQTTSGHHQIELACEACHASPFGGKALIQTACTGCHAEDLTRARDTHPLKKFTDPRNVDRLKALDATQCVTCHTEHRPRITEAMGVTQPKDFCSKCHEGIGRERTSHKDLAFTTCTSAGCHNYHDNRALYEDFLEKHLKEPATLASAVIKLRADQPARSETRPAITEAGKADAPASHGGNAALQADWLATAHAKGGVNCSGCHAPNTKDPTQIAASWIKKPDHTVCASCHQAEVKTFTEGKHGMRMAKGLRSSKAGFGGLFDDAPLTPMRPSLARLPMSPHAPDVGLTCTTCHGAHRFDTAKAQVETCLSCHADEHSRRYPGSPHHRLWQAERAGMAAKGTGVSCATCHMPRETRENPDTGEDELLVSHNQNANLRPNAKMIRSVCMNCHGLGFTLDALADPATISSNFAGRPSARVESIDWVIKRLKDREGQSGKTTGAK